MRGRPRKFGRPVIIHIRLRLWPGEDDDLIELLAIPRTRARLVKAALRGANVGKGKNFLGPSEDEIMGAFERMVFW